MHHKKITHIYGFNVYTKDKNYIPEEELTNNDDVNKDSLKREFLNTNYY